MDDPVVTALSALVDDRVDRRWLRRGERRRLGWVEAGAGSAVVVFVAGAGETALDWAPVIRAVAGTARVIVYDRAGLGASDPPSPLTVEAQVEDLAALLHEVGPAIVVGHSWGGLLAQLVALGDPDMVLGLVLVDPSHEEVIADITWLPRVASAIMLNGVVLLRAVGLFGRMARRMATALAVRSTDDHRIRTLIVGAYLACYSERTQVAMIRAENRLADGSAPWVRRARSASPLPDVPLVVLTATRGKPAKSVQRCAALAEQVVSSVRRGRHVVVGDSGHYIHHDQPAAVVDAIRHIIDATGSQMRQA